MKEDIRKCLEPLVGYLREHKCLREEILTVLHDEMTSLARKYKLYYFTCKWDKDDSFVFMIRFSETSMSPMQYIVIAFHHLMRAEDYEMPASAGPSLAELHETLYGPPTTHTNFDDAMKVLEE